MSEGPLYLIAVIKPRMELAEAVVERLRFMRDATREEPGNNLELEAARRELADLKERVKVLERIATDSNSGDAREQARIAAEIEALRALPAMKEDRSK